MDAGWAAVASAAVTGATAVVAILLTQRHERRRAEAERQDRYLGLLLEPRLRAHERLATYLVQLRQSYLRLASCGQDLAEQSEPSEWGPLQDVGTAETLFAENRLWLAPSVAAAFERLIGQLGLCASASLSLAGTPQPGDPQLEDVVIQMSGTVASMAEECGQVIRQALGLPAIESLHQRLAGTTEPSQKA
jgi:hypothetical protein